MKTFKLFIITALFTSSMFAFSPAHASTTAKTNPVTTSTNSINSIISGFLGGLFSSGGATYPIPSAGTSSCGTSLPINNNIWVLVVAASVVGLKVAMSKNRELVKGN